MIPRRLVQVGRGDASVLSDFMCTACIEELISAPLWFWFCRGLDEILLSQRRYLDNLVLSSIQGDAGLR